MTLLLLSAYVASAACPEPVGADAVGVAVTRAMEAYEEVDLPAFERAVEEARAAIPCLGEVLPTSSVAALHRAQGLAAFVANLEDPATRAFAAARRLEPSYRFPKTLVPEGNPVLAAYDALDPTGLAMEEVPAPADGALRVDGQPVRARPAGLPVVIQWVRPGGDIAASAYLWPGDPLPYELPAADPVSEPVTSAPRARSRRPFVVGAIVGGGLAAALYGINLRVHQVYVHPETPVDRLDGLRAANNRLVVASASALALGVASGGVALTWAR